jgi:hypothetical protein
MDFPKADRAFITGVRMRFFRNRLLIWIKSGSGLT